MSDLINKEKENKIMIVKGKLIKARRQSKTFKGKEQEEKLYVTLSDVELTKEQQEELKEAFKEAGKKFTPSWIDNFEGYVNVSTKFEIPTKGYDGKKYTSLEDYIADEMPNFYNAIVRLSLNVKDGAVYPKAIIFDTEGEEFDPFADFED